MTNHEDMERLIALGPLHKLVSLINSLNDIPEDLLTEVVAELSPKRREVVKAICQKWNGKSTVGPGETSVTAGIIKTIVASSLGIESDGARALDLAGRVKQLREEGVIGFICDVKLPQYGEIPLTMPGQRANDG